MALWGKRLISGPGEVHVALSFVPFREPGPSVSETDGPGMCLCSEVRHAPLSRGAPLISG